MALLFRMLATFREHPWFPLPFRFRLTASAGEAWATCLRSRRLDARYDRTWVGCQRAAPRLPPVTLLRCVRTTYRGCAGCTRVMPQTGPRNCRRADLSMSIPCEYIHGACSGRTCVCAHPPPRIDQLRKRRSCRLVRDSEELTAAVSECKCVHGHLGCAAARGSGQLQWHVGLLEAHLYVYLVSVLRDFEPV